jgi:hypothetical protein
MPALLLVVIFQSRMLSMKLLPFLEMLPGFTHCFLMLLRQMLVLLRQRGVVKLVLGDLRV